MCCCGLWAFHFLGQLAHTACGELVKIHTAFLYCFGHKVLIFHKKNQRMSLCSILAFSGGYLARLIWACTALYHSSTLLVSCLKLVKRSKQALTFTCLRLVELFKMIPDCIQAKVFFGKAPGHILVHARVLTPSYYLLALLAFWECCKLTFEYVLTFKSPVQESMV